MTQIVVSFRPLSRSRYQPLVWRGEYRKNGLTSSHTKVFERHKPIKKTQLEAFRSRFAPRRVAKKAIVYSPQKPMWKREDIFVANGYYAVTCGCGRNVRVPSDANKVTCEKCGAKTPIIRNFL